MRPGPRLAAAIALAAALAALAGPEARQTPRVLQAPLDPIAIDFRVLTDDGTPLAGLTAADVAVRIDGRPRTVRQLTFVRSVQADPAGAMARLPPPYGSNLATDPPRDIFFVVDTESFRPGRERALQEAVRTFAADLPDHDRTALVTMPYGGAQVALTTDRSALRQAISRITGQAPANESGSAAACRTRVTLQALTDLLRAMAGRETPVTVVYVSSGLVGPRRDAPLTLAPGMCELGTREFRLVGAAAAAARVQFYVVQPENVLTSGGTGSENIAGSGFGGPDNPREGLEHVVSVTGGRLLNLLGGEGALARIDRETAAYYVATVDRLSSDGTGTHQLDVRVARDDVTVECRPEVVAPAERPVRRVSPMDMLRHAGAFPALPLRVSAYASRASTAGQVSLVAMTEPEVPGTRLDALSVGVFTDDGRLVGQRTAPAADLAHSTLVTAFAVAPGRYRVRAAGVDDAGRGGAADYVLEARLTAAGPLQLSSLALGVSRPSGFEPRMLFSTEISAIAYLELYNSAPGVEVRVLFEVATSPDGPAVAAVPAAIAGTAEGDRFQATGTIAVGALPPRDYVVRATVRIGSQEGRVFQVLRKRGP